MYDPVLPSSLLGLQSEEDLSNFNVTYKNFGLKAGIITDAYEVDDKNNRTKLAPEYDVMVWEQTENKGIISTTYKNCISLDLFGGIADFFEYKKRVPEKKEYQKSFKFEDGNGYFVLMLCMDGIDEKGIIIGGIQHSKRKSKLTKDNKQQLEWEYNGINFLIDKDGALTVTFKSASDNDGKYNDPIASGTKIKIEKDGSLEMNDNEKNKIRIDKTKKDITVDANGGILHLKKGKVALGTKEKEIFAIVSKLLGVMHDNAKIFGKTIMGPAELNPLVDAALVEAKMDLDSIKGTTS